MNVLVIGGFGFIGSLLVKKIQSDDHDVYIYDSAGNLYRVNRSSNDRLARSESIDRVIENGKFGIVIYLASKLLPGTDINKNNLEAFLGKDFNLALNTLYSAKEHGVERFIFPSSGGSVYDDSGEHCPFRETDPLRAINAYGANKIAVEQHMQALNGEGFHAISLRIANPYSHIQKKNKGQGVIPIFIRNAIEGRKISVYGDGLNIRDYIHLEDVTDAFLRAISYQGAGTVFNIGSGMGNSITDIIKMIERVSGRKLDVEFHPARKIDKRYAVVDVSLAKKELSWAPRISLENGIRLSYEEIRREYP